MARHQVYQPRRTPQPPPAPASTRQVAGWLTHRPGSLTEDQHQQLKAIRNHCLELAVAHHLIRDFADMLTQQTDVFLPAWIDEALAANLPGMTGFTRGLDGVTWPSRAAARTAIFGFNEGWYIAHRLHGSLGCRSPADYETALAA